MGFLMVRAADAPPTPTPLPETANVEQSRPEIGGSYGGFIALVVVLAAIFILSCVGIFILLRNHEPTKYERQLRRSRRRNRDFSSELPIGPPGIRERFARLFGRRNGWIKASGGDGDEWDASDEPVPNAASELRERDVSPATIAGGPEHPWDRFEPSKSTDSVEVELRAHSGPSPTLEGPHPGIQYVDDCAYGDPPALRDSPPPMMVTAVPPVNDAHVGELEPRARDDTQFSVQRTSSETGSINLRSMRKFGNGTKFKEGLNF